MNKNFNILMTGKRSIGIQAFCLLVMLFLPTNIFSQISDCSRNYEKALLLYNGGMADSSLRMLQPCIENKKALNKLSKE